MSASAMLEIPEETMTPKRSKQTEAAAKGAALNGVERVVLTGFMGSGKTTVGRRLAARLGWAFHDLDGEIERRAGMTVPAIFAAEGEEGFRRQESSALAALLGSHQTVIALGGGAPEVLGNRLLLEQTPKTAVVYLAAPLEVLVARCERQAAEGEATERPLLSEAAERFKVRHPLYQRIAKHRVATSAAGPEEVVSAVLDVLQNRR